MTIKLADIQDIDKIDDYIKNHNIANLYHDYRWGTIIEKCFGHKCHVLLSMDSDGSINGILPLVHMKSFSFGNFIVSDREGPERKPYRVQARDPLEQRSSRKNIESLHADGSSGFP